MATITKQTIYLDLTPGRVFPVLHVSQGDTGLKALEFKLVQNDMVFNIPAAVTDIQINGTTPLGVFSYNHASGVNWSGNTVTAAVTQTMTEEAGMVVAELVLLDSAMHSIGSLNFLLSVEPSPYTVAHVSTSDMASISASLNAAQQNFLMSKSWAVGDTGLRDGEATNNSKYWAEESDKNGQRWSTGSVNGTAVPSSDPAYHNNSKYWSEQSAINGERWSVGKINGEDVPSTDETYHNNGKYWAGVAEDEKELAAQYGSGLKAQVDTNSARITQEVNDRSAAISSEASTRSAAISSEASTRSAAVSSLQSQINQYVKPSTQQPDEVVNARVGADGTTYSTLGNAVREQITGLKNDLKNDLINSAEIIENGYSVTYFDLYPGFLSANGSVMKQSSGGQAEVYTSYIPANEEEKYIVKTYFTETVSAWMRICYYDSTKTFISVITPFNNVSTDSTNIKITIPANASYMRISYNTWNSGRLVVYKDGYNAITNTIYTKIDNLKDEVKDTTLYAKGVYEEEKKEELIVVQGASRLASNLVFETSIPNGAQYTFRIEDDGEHIGNYAVYSNQSILRSRCVVNTDYTFTATSDLDNVSIYYDAANALESGTVVAKLSIALAVEESLDARIDNVKESLDQLNKKYETGYNYCIFDLKPGFINSGGSINTGTKGEVYTSLFSAKVGETFIIETDLTESGHDQWIAVAEYDETETFISRRELLPSSPSTTTQKVTVNYTVPTGVSFFRVTVRLYNIGTLTIKQKTALEEKLESLTEQQIQLSSNVYASNTVKTIAHRGDDIDAPQCVAAAYIYAKKRGHTIAENDVWNSEDGQLVMWHDINLNRLGNLVDINGYAMYTDGTDYYWVDESNNVYTYDFNNSEYVSSAVSLSSLTRCIGSAYGVNSDYDVIGLNLNILKRIDFGVYKGSKFQGEQILTFAEWVLLCKQLGMEIYIDRKISYTQAVVTELVNTVKSYGMLDKTSWINVGTSAIDLIRAIDPDARCGILTHPTESLIETYKPYNIGRGFFFNGNGKEMTREAIRLGLNAGFEVEVWYVDFGNTSEETVFQVLRNAVSYGCTGITTDKYRIDEAFTELFNKYDD